MPYIWIFMLVLTTVWAFWADVVFAPISLSQPLMAAGSSGFSY